jgi:regulator of protease activity HflC (stomatin/prohibitin superfamily)
MVEIVGKSAALQRLKVTSTRFLLLALLAAVVVAILYGSCTTRVLPNEYGVQQQRFGIDTGIDERVYGPGLYFLGPGVTMHAFPRGVQILEASNDREEARSKAKTTTVARKVDEYFDQRRKLLVETAHMPLEAFTVQTSDGYSVIADITLLYSITDPVRVAKDFGWGSLYVEGFVVNTFRNGVLSTLGKMNAESFYDEKERIARIKEAEDFLKEKFAGRGFKAEKLLLGSYTYAPNYEKSLHDKKVAVQLAEKNRKAGLVNDERAKLQQIESKGNASITIAESEVNAEISKIRAEAELYASQNRARADKEYGFASAEAKRLKADALNSPGGRYVVALQTAKMFDNINSAVMTPEQYIAFIRQSWSLIGLSPGGPVGASAPKEAKR